MESDKPKGEGQPPDTRSRDPRNEPQPPGSNIGQEPFTAAATSGCRIR